MFCDPWSTVFRTPKFVAEVPLTIRPRLAWIRMPEQPSERPKDLHLRAPYAIRALGLRAHCSTATSTGSTRLYLVTLPPRPRSVAAPVFSLVSDNPRSSKRVEAKTCFLFGCRYSRSALVPTPGNRTKEGDSFTQKVEHCLFVCLDCTGGSLTAGWTEGAQRRLQNT